MSHDSRATHETSDSGTYLIIRCKVHARAGWLREIHAGHPARFIIFAQITAENAEGDLFMVRLGKKDAGDDSRKPSKMKLGFSIAFMIVCMIIIISRIVGNTNDSNETAAAPKETDTPVKQEQTVSDKTEPAQPAKKKQTSAEDRVYAEWVVDHGTRYSDAMNRFSALMSDPQIGNDEWGIKVVAVLEDMKTLVKESKEKESDVPKKFKKVHHYIVNANDEFSYVAENLPRAIDILDTAEMDKIGDKIKAGENEIGKATDELLKVN